MITAAMLADGSGGVWGGGGVVDLARSLEDASAGGVDDVSDGGAVRAVGECLLCPAGDIGEGVLAAVQTMRGRDEVGHGFRFDFLRASALEGGLAVCWVVE
ncbi:hypothetical protein AAEX63_05375 [Luteococcus sp. H138]|uniref:hypothetical protein n=1 Tax=unclassified Luteococcus TaxID=2639923 RepID=UPI00313BACC5